MGGFASRSRPSSGATPPILPPGIAHTETHVWRIRAAACRPCTRKAVPTQSNRQPLSALNPSQTCTRKGGANPKATRGILPHKPPIRLKKSVKQALARIATLQANTCQLSASLLQAPSELRPPFLETKAAHPSVCRLKKPSETLDVTRFCASMPVRLRPRQARPEPSVPAPA